MKTNKLTHKPSLKKSNSAVLVSGSHNIKKKKILYPEPGKDINVMDYFFSLALDLLCIADTDGNFIKLNRQWESALGYKLKYLEGKNFFDFIHPDDIKSTVKAVKNLKAQNDVLNFVNRYRRKDGTYRWIEWKSKPVGKLIFAAARDITEKKLAEDELNNKTKALYQANKMLLKARAGLEKRIDKKTREKEAIFDFLKKEMKRSEVAERQVKQLQLAMTKSNNAIIIADISGKIEWVNEGFEKLTEYSLKDIQADLSNPCRPPGLDTDSKYFSKLLNKRKPVTYETKKISKSGKEYWVLATMSLVYDEDSKSDKIIIIDSDITKIKKAEEELKKARALAVEATKLKEAFLANMSHEIRTPMNSIIGFSVLLKKTYSSGKEREYIDAINDSGRNLMAIINDILDISKIEAGMMNFSNNTFSVRGIFKSLSILLNERIREKNISLKLICSDNLPEVLVGDDIRLSQIILNLAGNAIKFTSKGEVIISAKVIHRQKDSTLLEFSVKDTGIGIPKDKIKHIFERFRQADYHTAREYGGSGLGLSIVKQLVELQGGTLSVKSKVNLGSEFSFRLAYKNSEALLIEKGEKPKYKIEDLSALNILLVEDSPLNVKLVSSLFSDNNLRLEVADNGRKCLDMVKVNEFDLILMDMELPEISGYEATAFIRNVLKKNIPIIAMTAHAMAGEREKCLRYGMNDYISKPINPNILFEKIYNLTLLQ